ncbi:chaperone protein clpb1 [Nicotiana attenuata]|uniref:Chaperone protein clpb1 n=1 Tax=Nicotiana attenuata TaxID=49451 RepID=A0A1J6IR20_NICAT|nr:chaperone protein clpb1 [Nicotiana attenuata]
MGSQRINYGKVGFSDKEHTARNIVITTAYVPFVPKRIRVYGKTVITRKFELGDEIHALEKENDKASNVRFVEVRQDLDYLRDKLQFVMLRYKKKKEKSDEICRLNQKRDELMYALQEVEKGYDIVRATNLTYEELQEMVAAIANLKSGSNENSMLTESVREPELAIALTEQLSNDNKIIFRKEVDCWLHYISSASKLLFDPIYALDGFIGIQLSETFILVICYANITCDRARMDFTLSRKDSIWESISMVQINTTITVLSSLFPLLNLDDKVLILVFSPVEAQYCYSNTWDEGPSRKNFQNYALVCIVGAILLLVLAVIIWFTMRRSTNNTANQLPPALAMAQQHNTDRDDNNNTRISVSSFPLVPMSESHGLSHKLVWWFRRSFCAYLSHASSSRALWVPTTND